MNVSVSDKTRLVEDSFNKLISGLRPNDETRQQYETDQPLSAEDATDVADKFKLWAGNIGARHPPHSALSLEQRLVAAPELRDQATSLLDDLIEALADLFEIITNSLPNRVIAAAEDGSQESDNEDVSYAEKEEAQDILDVAGECIRGLLKLSVLIRKATPRDRFAKALQTRDDEPFLDQFDISYVAERYPKLSRAESKWLCERLGRAITKRRHFLRYSRDHRSRIAGEDARNAAETRVNMTSAKPGNDPTLTDRNAALHAASGSIMESVHTKPSTKASTLDIAKLRALAEDRDDEGASYVSAGSSVQISSEEARLVLPTMQDVSGGKPIFECPLCFGIQTFTRERSWRRHAYQDLKAYVCTLGRDQCEFELFGDSRAWFEHELRCHRRQFTCILCQSGPFQTEERFHAHIQKHHRDVLVDDSQASMLLTAGQRPVDEIPAQDCPFCDEWAESLKDAVPKSLGASDSIILVASIQFRRHVALHLEQLALFVISRGTIGKDDNDADSDTDVARSRITKFAGSTTSAGGEGTVSEDLLVPDPPLHIAAAKGNLAEVRRLIEEGVEVNCPGETWGTVMKAAATPEIRQLLKQYGAEEPVRSIQTSFETEKGLFDPAGSEGFAISSEMPEYPGRWQCEYSGIRGSDPCSWTGPGKAVEEHFKSDHYDFQESRYFFQCMVCFGWTGGRIPPVACPRRYCPSSAEAIWRGWCYGYTGETAAKSEAREPLRPYATAVVPGTDSGGDRLVRASPESAHFDRESGPSTSKWNMQVVADLVRNNADDDPKLAVEERIRNAVEPDLFIGALYVAEHGYADLPKDLTLDESPLGRRRVEVLYGPSAASRLTGSPSAASIKGIPVRTGLDQEGEVGTRKVPLATPSGESPTAIEDVLRGLEQLEHQGLEYFDELTLEKARAADVEELDERGWQIASLDQRIIGFEPVGGSDRVTRCKLEGQDTVFALKLDFFNIKGDSREEIVRTLLQALSCKQDLESGYLCRIYGAFIIPYKLYIAMEYCEGGSLDSIYKEVQRRQGRIAEKVLGKVAESALGGLSYLYSKGFIHRDVKPSNILLCRDGAVKLTDFNFAPVLSTEGDPDTFVGTAYYMSPERITGRSYTITSDVWSLGVTLLEVAQLRYPFSATGEGPSQNPSLIDILTGIVRNPTPKLEDEPEVNIFWSGDFKYFLESCLEKEPSRRATPSHMLEHPWMVEVRTKRVNMSGFVAQVWGWDEQRDEVHTSPRLAPSASGSLGEAELPSEAPSQSSSG